MIITQHRSFVSFNCVPNKFSIFYQYFIVDQKDGRLLAQGQEQISPSVMENLLLCTVKFCTAGDVDRNNCFQVTNIFVVIDMRNLICTSDWLKTNCIFPLTQVQSCDMRANYKQLVHTVKILSVLSFCGAFFMQVNGINMVLSTMCCK